MERLNLRSLLSSHCSAGASSLAFTPQNYESFCHLCATWAEGTKQASVMAEVTTSQAYQWEPGQPGFQRSQAVCFSDHHGPAVFSHCLGFEKRSEAGVGHIFCAAGCSFCPEDERGCLCSTMTKRIIVLHIEMPQHIIHSQRESHPSQGEPPTYLTDKWPRDRIAV